MVLLVLLSGCGTETKPADPIVPVEGTWWHDTTGFSEDGCRLEGSLGVGSFELSDLTDDGFTYTDFDLGAVLCGLGAVDFSCNTISTTDTYDDTTLTLSHSAEGTLTTEASMNRLVVIEGDCEGSLCDDFGDVTFPCTTQLEATASAQ